MPSNHNQNRDTQKPLLFIGQCLTETRSIQKRDLIQEVLNVVKRSIDSICRHTQLSFDFGPGAEKEVFTAKYAENFKEHFKKATGMEFSAEVFAAWRKSFLDKARGLIIIRTDMTESRHFEMGQFSARYPQDWAKRTFFLIADLPEAELKTTLTKVSNLIHFGVISHRDPNTAITSYCLANPTHLERTLTTSLLASPMIKELIPSRIVTPNRNHFHNGNGGKATQQAVFPISKL